MIANRKAIPKNCPSAMDADRQFRNIVEEGMGCTPFISKALSQAVHKIYLLGLDSHPKINPGQILFPCLSKRKRSGSRPIDEEKKKVVLTLDGGKIDENILRKNGIDGLRRFRTCRICAEAFKQGGLLTVEDIAYRLFNVGRQTIVRDLAAIRKNGVNPRLR